MTYLIFTRYLISYHYLLPYCYSYYLISSYLTYLSYLITRYDLPLVSPTSINMTYDIGLNILPAYL